MSKILVIDDNLEVRENTVELLQYEGFDTYSAEEGTSGFKRTLEIMPDMILCDLLMPNTDGLEFYTLLKRTRQLNNIPIVFFSADSYKLSDSIPENVSYLRKPFTSEELLAIIKLKIHTTEKYN